MKYFGLLAALIFALSSCGEEKTEKLPEGFHRITAKEILQDAEKYTYILAEENGKEYWLACPKIDVKDGDKLYYSKGMEMNNFESKSLGRTFETIIFVEDMRSHLPGSDEEKPEADHPKIENAPAPDISVKPLPGGMTIAEIVSRKEELGGKSVKIRGKVTKFNPEILGKNWIHIQDGTKENGIFDLTVTTQDQAKPGEIVIVEGILALDKDFGAGYIYEIILEEAKILSETDEKIM